MKYKNRCCVVWAAALLTACVQLDLEPAPGEQEAASETVSVEEVARLLASLPLGPEQMQEVFDAAGESAGNGYDEEYRMRELLQTPGLGVGGSATKAREYARPLRELLREALSSTKADNDLLERLGGSDVQIYWPYALQWDGLSLPIVTFDPFDETAETNVGYRLGKDGTLEKILVDESLTRECPVWVVNRNTDAEYKTLELLRREDPDWGNGGGDIVVKPSTKTAPADIKTLILRSFKAKRQFDSWFSGASEFFVKLGSVDDFSGGMTEAELRIFEPSITDFMIVVRRGQVGEAIPFNAVLVSEWTEELVSSAFMIVEDDGGTRTTWKASAVVKYNSKSYGVEVEFPINTRDDIVWRGSLSRNYILKYDGIARNYGDVELVLEFV